MYGHRLARELLGLLFLFCGLLMLLSLWSYDAGDPTSNLAVSTRLPQIKNAAGLFGAYLAGFLVDSFGLGSFLWIIFFLAVGAGLVSRWIVIKWYRWAGYILLFACLLTAATAAGLSWNGIRGGGLTGTWLEAFSYRMFSPAGSLLIWTFAFLISMELSFSISWLSMLSKLLAAIAALFPALAKACPRIPSMKLPEGLASKASKLLAGKKAPAEPSGPRFDIVAEAEAEEVGAENNAAEPDGGTKEQPAGQAAQPAAGEQDELDKMLDLIELPGDSGASEPSGDQSGEANGTAKAPESSETVGKTEDGLLSLDSEGTEDAPAPMAIPSSGQVSAGSALLSLEPEDEAPDVGLPEPEASGCISTGQVPDALDPADPAAHDAPAPEKPAGTDALPPEDMQNALLPPEENGHEDTVLPDNPGEQEPVTGGSPAAAQENREAAFGEQPAAPAESGSAAPASAQAEPLPGGTGDDFIIDLAADTTAGPIKTGPVESASSACAGPAAPEAAVAAATAGTPACAPQAEVSGTPSVTIQNLETKSPAPAAPVALPAEPPAPATGNGTVPAAPVTKAGPDDDDNAVSNALQAGRAATEQENAAASVAEGTEPALEEQPRPALPPRRQYIMPKTDLLDPLPAADLRDRPDPAMLAQQGRAVITCLRNFNVHAELAKITPGPVVTMFEVRPAPGVKAARITNLANDLAMSLKAKSVRMQAPVPGTDTVGIEVPALKRATVYFREVIEHPGFTGAKSLLTIALGKDISGVPVSVDLSKMPHLLVAGATGKGKSVCLNSILISLLFRARPDEMKLILVDPKRVEFSMYADLPHLVHPVVTDMEYTKNALLWAVDEMLRRLDVFSKAMVRNITGYNERVAKMRAEVEAGSPVPRDADGREEDLAFMPFLVIVIDELADLMQMKRKEVESPIIRLAQMGRAAGLHLIIATQRPSVDVVTGLIKANFPCRIAFEVTNGQDSRTILDTVGAEKLLGMGDMLFKPNGDSIRRLHGSFVSDHDVAAVVNYWKRQQKPDYQADFSKCGDDEPEEASESFGTQVRGNDISDDPLYAEAVQFVYENGGRVSISLLQRRLRVGFNRAARFFEQMEKDGIVTQADGTKPRSVIQRQA